MKKVEQVYCLKEKRPKVLLLGNGLTRDSGGKSWYEALEEIAEDKNKFAEYLKNPENIREGFWLPNTPLALVTAPVSDSERRKRYEDAFRQSSYHPIPLLERLVCLPFQAILTTNYTYEVENALYEEFYNLKACTQRGKSISYYKGEGRDTHLLQRCNVVFPEAPQIWHIHGEINRRSSVVLTHDEYARLITDVLGYLRKQENRYADTVETFEFHSWIDYLLMADVFILGQGFDYSEFDLWWMLGRRMREKAQTGSIVFYEPGADCGGKKAKHSALDALGVDVRNLGFSTKNEKDYPCTDDYYRAFYEKAVDDIEKDILS